MSEIRKNAETIMLENWDTPEFQNILKKSVEEYKKKQDIKKKKINKMFSNTDYVDWLINFTIMNNNCFSDDSWLYCPDDITKNDSEKVNDLYLLYSGIDSYADENNINPTLTEYGNYYKIKINDIGLKIGIDVGQGAYCYCEKIDINDNKDFIDFLDINNSKTSNKTLKRKK